jgi:hypothetical protein
MSLTIPFTPEVEARLRERAAASGKDVGTFVREVVEEKLELAGAAERSNGQWAAEFDAWMKEVASRASAYPTDFAVDDSRESIYEGRGE